MFYDNLPDVRLEDWERFKKGFDPLSYIYVLDRYDAGLMPFFFPLARGVIVASGWMRDYSTLLFEDTKYFEARDQGCYWTDGMRMVRLWEDAVRPLWSVERVESGIALKSGFDEVLVHTFGATPIFCTTSYTAKRLALHCDTYHVPGTRWAKFPRTRDELHRQTDHASLRASREYLRTLSAQIVGANSYPGVPAERLG